MDDIVKPHIKEEDVALMEDFRLLDDFFMTLVFEENYEATELLLNIILERDDMRVIRLETQKEEKNPIVGGRSIKLDIYAEDSDGKIYDVEIQRSDEGADVHRARFYSSVLDSRMLKASQKFSELHDSYIIFFTEHDIMEMGLPMYHVDRVVQESKKHFGDGSHIIYVNGAYKNDETPIGKLTHDFRCTRADDMFYRELADSVRFYKETEGGRVKMSKTIEDMKHESKLETKLDDIKNIMEKLNYTLEQAMNLLNVSDNDRAILIKRF